MENEVWKPIHGYESLYEVSNMGNIRNIKTGKVLKGDTNSLGYRRVWLHSNNPKRFFVHRIVAFEFCDGYSDRLVVNHKDGDKSNNKASNLEWVTRSENDKHAVKTGLRANQYIPHKPKYMIRTFNILDGSTIKIYKNRQDFCEQNGYSVSSVQAMLARGYFVYNGVRIGIETAIKFNI